MCNYEITYGEPLLSQGGLKFHFTLVALKERFCVFFLVEIKIASDRHSLQKCEPSVSNAVGKRQSRTLELVSKENIALEMALLKSQ